MRDRTGHGDSFPDIILAILLDSGGWHALWESAGVHIKQASKQEEKTRKKKHQESRTKYAMGQSRARSSDSKRNRVQEPKDSDVEEDQGISKDQKKIPAQIKLLQSQLIQERNTAGRLRHLRNQYRSTVKEFAIRVTQLEQQQQKQEEEEEVYDSDDEGESLYQHTKKDHQRKEGHAVSQRSSEGFDKHYPDVPNFYGNEGQWGSWHMHL